MGSPMRQGGLQHKLERAQMFRPQYQIPVGDARRGMDARQFAEYAQPTVQDHMRREGDLFRLFGEHEAGPKVMRDGQMRAVLLPAPPPTHEQLLQQQHQHAQRRSLQPTHQQAAQRSQVVLDDSAAAAIVDGQVGLNSKQQQQAKHHQHYVQQYQQDQQHEHQQHLQHKPAIKHFSVAGGGEPQQQLGRAPPQGRPRRALASEGYVPSSAILGADPNYSYLNDRDQQQVWHPPDCLG